MDVEFENKAVWNCDEKKVEKKQLLSKLNFQFKAIKNERKRRAKDFHSHTNSSI